MNDFFKNKRLLIMLLPLGLFLTYIYYHYAKLASSPPIKLPPPAPTVERGSIVDRNGRPVAVQTNFYHFGITPKMVTNPEVFAAAVSPALEMSARQIVDIIAANKGRNFAYLKKKISQSQYDELTKIISEHEFTTFCRFDRIPGRVYPQHDLASQLIGYMGTDGVGLSGIEYSEQEILSPEPVDGDSGIIYGQNIYLTIDSDMQFKLEKIAKRAMEDTQAENLMLIASSVRTGEVLSYISLPAADLNDYPSATTAEKIDLPAVAAYEPGSVFKIFTSAAYIDSDSVTPDTLFFCDGIYERTTNLGERIEIRCLDHHGWVTVREALKYSCNDALAQMSDMLETDRFLDYIHQMGFGERTGVELPAETRGTIKDQNDRYWSARSKATMSIGQELSVNALQMIQAANTIANGGIPVQLTFIHRVTDRDGQDTYVHTPQYGERILKKSTADYILSCMETTAKTGTGSRANLRDISIGVKTGTAQMADPVHGGYSQTDFLSNCMAIFPVEDPQIALYIVIQKAKGETYAGRIVAPVVKEAADEIIDHLGMNRELAPTFQHTGRISIKENAPLTIGQVVPDFSGRPKRDLLPLLERSDIAFIINGQGYVIRQTPAPGTPVTEGMTIELTLE